MPDDLDRHPADSEPTQQIRRPVIPPLPAGLDPVGRTETMSVSEIFDAAPEAPAAPTTHATPAAASTPAAPVVTPRATAAEHPPITVQVRSDAAAVLDGLRRNAPTWLRAGDNALVAATTLIALLLVVAVAAL